MTKPILISPAQLRACQVLRAEVERLIKLQAELSRESTAAMKQADNTEWKKGYYTGRATAYELAAEWLQKAMQEADK